MKKVVATHDGLFPLHLAVNAAARQRGHAFGFQIGNASFFRRPDDGTCQGVIAAPLHGRGQGEHLVTWITVFICLLAASLIGA